MTAILICALVFLGLTLAAIQETKRLPDVRYKDGIDKVEIHRSTIVIPTKLTSAYNDAFIAMGYYRYSLNTDLFHPLKMLWASYRLKNQIMERAICCERYYQLTGVDKVATVNLITQNDEMPFSKIPRGKRNMLVVRAKNEARIWLAVNKEKLRTLCP